MTAANDDVVPASKPKQKKIVIAAGTYEGAVAGYEVDQEALRSTSTTTTGLLQLAFCTPAHQGSVRAVASCSKQQQQQQQQKNHATSSTTTTTTTTTTCILVSIGYDEVLQLHDFGKRTTGTGHVRTPPDCGTPTVVAFAPPSHCLVGFDGGGAIVIYKRRDWSVQHVLKGHEGGVGALAVHPTSSQLAVSGGLADGKLKVWDLERGRLAFSSTAVPVANTHVDGKKRYDAIECIVWRKKQQQGASIGQDYKDCYAFCYGSHITVRDVATGNDLLDVDLPSKVNQVCFIDGEHGLFVAAACNDGSLPVLAVDGSDEERRAVLAIEPASAISGVERYKCIQEVSGYCVATATSTGVVSIMDLSGAVNMILSNVEENDDDDGDDDDDDDQEEREESDDAEVNSTGSLELAVNILDSQLLGTGARITCLSVWTPPAMQDEEAEKLVGQEISVKDNRQNGNGRRQTTTVLGDDEVKKARALVSKAKKIQRKKNKRKHGIKKDTKAR